MTLRPVRVLIADDQRLFAESLRLVLETDDRIAVVDIAGDGVDAVARASQLSPDVILMDVNMPRLDGVEATRQIRASGSSAAIILMTGTDRRIDASDVRMMGATAFVRKTESVDSFRSIFFALASISALLAPAVSTT